MCSRDTIVVDLYGRSYLPKTVTAYFEHKCTFTHFYNSRLRKLSKKCYSDELRLHPFNHKFALRERGRGCSR